MIRHIIKKRSPVKNLIYVFEFIFCKSDLDGLIRDFLLNELIIKAVLWTERLKTCCPEKPIRSFTFLQLISASEDGSVALIDRRIRKVLKRLHFTKGTYPMCMKPSGRTLYVGDKVIFCFLIYKIIEPLLCILSIWYDGMLDDENEALIMRKKIFLENFYMKNLSSEIYFVDFQVGNLHLIDLSTKNPLKKMKTVFGLHSGKVTGVDTHLGGIVTCSSDGKVCYTHTPHTHIHIHIHTHRGYNRLGFRIARARFTFGLHFFR